MCPRHPPARDFLSRLIAAAVVALGTMLAPPAGQAAQGVPILIETTISRDDNLGRSANREDKRGDTAARLGVAAEDARVLGRDWLLSTGVAVRAEHWLEYDRFDTSDFEARLSLRRRFGLGPTAPALRLALTGGPRVAREDDRAGWTGLAALEFSHRPWSRLRYTVAFEGERIDTRDEFYDITGRSFSGELTFFPDERWALAAGLAHRFGNVLAFATPPPSWRFLSPHLSAAPLRRSTGFFDDPFVAYNIEAATHEGSFQISRALGEHTRLGLGFTYADTRRDGLRYLNRLTSIGLSRRF